jgi:thiol-disulfide isomerase/thioredoxin
MNRLGITIGLAALMALACGKGEAPNTIEGRLVGADGKTPPLAHVHLIAMGDDIHATVKSVPVAEDGSFRLEVPADGYYDALVTAVNHRPFRVPLASDAHFDIRGIRLTPEPYRYRRPLEDAGIIGDWDNFSRREAEPMAHLDDGTFMYDRDVDADTLAYQLVGPEVSGRSINGTDSDYYIYDGGGDYISVVRTEDGKGIVTFDPEKAQIVTDADLPEVDFGTGAGVIAEAWEIQKRFLAEADRMNEALQAYMAQGGSYQDFEYDMEDIRQFLMDRMTLAEDEATRRYAALTLAGFLEQGLPLEDEEALAVAERLPVTDRMWAAQPMALPEVFRDAYGENKMVGMFEADLSKVAEPKVHATMLLEIGLASRASGDTARQRRIYDELVSGDSTLNLPYLSYRIRAELDPDLRVAPGKPVPDFEVALLDGETVSNKSMLGKHYLIDFWATWCGPCVGEMPYLERTYSEYGGNDFQILSISFDRSVADIERFRQENWKMPWLHAFAEGMFQSPIAAAFEVTAIPKPVLVDPQGVIVAVGPSIRGEHLEEAVGQALGTEPPLP